MMRPLPIPGHALVAYEEDFLVDGVVAVCECGWKSAEWPNQVVALEAHATHLSMVEEKAESKSLRGVHDGGL